MSHFTVVICIDDPARLEAVMERWDENREVTPYRDYEDGGPAEYWGVKSLREHGLNPDDTTLTWAQVAEAHNRVWDDGEPMLIGEDGRAYRMSTRNPEAKWDWWQIGGRWSGYFIARDSRKCDQGRKADLDLEALCALKAKEAREEHARYKAVVAGLPEALPWSVYRDNISEGNGYTIDQAREDYHAQPAVRALADSEEFRWHDGEDVAEFAKPADLYAAHAKARAVPGYATVTTDGRWMAPGRMGWFAAHDDSEGDRIGYWEAANAYIGSLSDSTWLIALDCHI